MRRLKLKCKRISQLHCNKLQTGVTTWAKQGFRRIQHRQNH